MTKIGFLGTGEIAAVMVRGLAGQGHQIAVSSRNAQVAAELARNIPEVSVMENADVVAQSDVVVLCLMAKVARQVLSDLPWRADQAIISAMIDLPLAELGALCAPIDQISLTIPMPFIDRGGCPLPVYPDSPAVHELFGGQNVVIPVNSEDALNAHFIASSLSAPLLSMFDTGVSWLADMTGDRVGAEEYVTTLFKGYMTADGSGKHFQTLMHSMSTQGGLNATLRGKIEAAGAPEVLRNGMDSLRPRLGLPPKDEFKD